MAAKTITDRGLEGRVTGYGERAVARIQANVEPRAGVVHVSGRAGIAPTAFVLTVTLYDPKPWLTGPARETCLRRLEKALNELRAQNGSVRSLARLGVRFEVRHLERMSTQDERAAHSRLDFPIYLLSAHTANRTTSGELRALLLDHGARDVGLAAEELALALAAWGDPAAEGGALDPLAGFRRVGFVKGDVVARATQAEIAFANVTLHELAHMCGVRGHVTNAKSVLREGVLLANGPLDYDDATQRQMLAHVARLVKSSDEALAREYEKQSL